MEFFGREEEIRELSRIRERARASAHFTVITGRRRVGKTELVKKTMGDEPNGEFGFGMYEAVRDVFGVRPAGGWPVNYVPADVGRGPYPVADDDGGPVHPFNGLRWR